jgi:hypothetical protein
MNQKYVLAVLSGIISLSSLYGQGGTPQRVITTAVPFLRISTDARASGMGDVGIATSPDANAAYWNPGKVPFNEKRGGIALNYSPWLRDLAGDMNIASVNGYYKLDEGQSIQGSLRYFSMGDVQFTDEQGYGQQAFHPREWAMDMGYARKLSERSGLGIGIGYIHSGMGYKGTNDYEAGDAVAANIGYYYRAIDKVGNGWSFGGALSNLGSKMAYNKKTDQKDYLPANMGLGGAYTRVLNEQNRISIGMDINKLLVPTPPAGGDSVGMRAYRSRSVIGSWFRSFGDAPGGLGEELKEVQVAVGGEYWYNNQFALRAGYSYEDRSKGNRRYFTVGAGVKYNVFHLNFSYLAPTGSGVERSPLSNTMRFGLVVEGR